MAPLLCQIDYGENFESKIKSIPSNSKKKIEFHGSDPGKNIKIDFLIRLKGKNFIFFLIYLLKLVQYYGRKKI